MNYFNTQDTEAVDRPQLIEEPDLTNLKRMGSMAAVIAGGITAGLVSMIRSFLTSFKKQIH